MKFSSSAPANLMLFGEHAVLHGLQALCCAVDQRIHVELTPRPDNQIHLHSALGSCVVTLDQVKIQTPFEFVLTAIDHYRNHFRTGFDLTITAEFAATVGLGSSAAVSVATVAVLASWLGLHLSPLQLFNDAKAVIVAVQGVGSGADVAAAVFGGVVAYRMDPLEIKPFSIMPDIVLVYSGAKVPTRTVIQYVAEQQRDNPELYQRLFDGIDACTQAAIAALAQQDWVELGELMNIHQKLQEALGVSTPLLNTLITDLCQQPTIYGAKISGSGLGDCVVGLGMLPERFFPVNAEQQSVGVQQIPVKISIQGCQVSNSR